MGVTTSDKSQKARAWVNFDGTGTIGTNMTLRASFNVSSVFKNATGDYTINFTTAMPDANYAVVTSSGDTGSTAMLSLGITDSTSVRSASSVRVKAKWQSAGTTNVSDVNEGHVAIFR